MTLNMPRKRSNLFFLFLYYFQILKRRFFSFFVSLIKMKKQNLFSSAKTRIKTGKKITLCNNYSSFAAAHSLVWRRKKRKYEYECNFGNEWYIKDMPAMMLKSLQNLNLKQERIETFLVSVELIHITRCFRGVKFAFRYPYFVPNRSQPR